VAGVGINSTELLSESWLISKMDFMELGCEDNRRLVLVQSRVQRTALIINSLTSLFCFQSLSF
jgi:hypothetical protein